MVKGFNNIFFQHLAALPRPAGAEDRSALPIAGDDPEAKQAVSELLDEIGYDTVDLGASRRDGARSPTRRRTASCTP